MKSYSSPRTLEAAESWIIAALGMVVGISFWALGDDETAGWVLLFVSVFFIIGLRAYRKQKHAPLTDTKAIEPKDLFTTAGPTGLATTVRSAVDGRAYVVSTIFAVKGGYYQTAIFAIENMADHLYHIEWQNQEDAVRGHAATVSLTKSTPSLAWESGKADRNGLGIEFFLANVKRKQSELATQAMEWTNPEILSILGKCGLAAEDETRTK